MLGYKVILSNNKNISLAGDVTYDTNELKVSPISEGANGFYFYPNLHSIDLTITEFNRGATIPPVKIVTIEAPDEDIIGGEDAINSLKAFSKCLCGESKSIKRTDDMKELSPLEYVNGLIKEYDDALSKDIFDFTTDNYKTIGMQIAYMAYHGVLENDILKALKIKDVSNPSKAMENVYYHPYLYMMKGALSQVTLALCFEYGLMRKAGSSAADIYKTCIKDVHVKSLKNDSLEFVNKLGLLDIAQRELHLFADTNLSRYYKNR